MTKEEFNNYVDSLNIEDVSELSDDELYDLGIKYQEVPTSQRRWNDFVEMFEINKTGEQFRIWLKDKKYAKGEMKKNVQMLSGQTVQDLTFPEAEKKLEEIKNDLYIQQTKTRDQRNSLRRTLRDEARLQDWKDRMESSIKTLKPIKFDSYTYPAEEDKEAVMLFSDLHMGANFKNFYNEYNPEIAAKRVNKFVDDVITQCIRNRVTKLNFANLGDVCHGGIHLSARLENNEDRNDEIIQSSEIIANALIKLSESIPEVIYRSTFGNHDRWSPNLHEHIEKENMIRLVDCMVELRVKGSKVKFAKDNLDDTIGLFELNNGKLFAFVHGDKDKDYSRSLLGLTSYLDRKIDYLGVGHFHSINVKSIQGSYVFTNGSIMGVDPYATTVRYFGPAAQSLLIFDKTSNVINTTINLDIR